MNELQQLQAALDKIVERRAGLVESIKTLVDRYRSDAWTDGAKHRFDDLERAVEKLDEEAAPLRDRMHDLVAAGSRRDAQRSALGSRTDLFAATGDGAAGTAQHRDAGFNISHGRFRDPAEIYDRSSLSVAVDEHGGEYRDRALAAIDGWARSTPAEWKESAAAKVEDSARSRNSRAIADHILRLGNPAYVEAFELYLRGGPQATALFNEAQREAFRDGLEYTRAINEGSVSAGQAIVPPFLDPTIILTNAGIRNPFRQMATVKTITTQTWKGVTSAGVSAEWTAEAAEMTDASPTFVQPSITPVRADAYIQASFETLEDTTLGSEVALLFADARDRLEGTAFAVGTGSTQPTGVVTALQLVTASRTSATTNGSIGYVDLLALDSNLPARYRNNDTAWAMAKGIANVIRALPLPSSVNFSPWVDFGGALPPKLIGYELYEASAMQNSLSAATASNDDVVVLGDFRQGYYIVDRIGLSVAYNPLVLGSNRRPTGEVGWAAFWRVGGNVVSASAFQMLRV